MSPYLALLIVVAYFGVLLLISWRTSRKADHQTFFTANRDSPWYVVAFGMIGASLSGVTFLSVPGAVGNTGWSYFQIVLGYLLGYLLIGTVLLPLYYRLQLTSIYEYLRQRFGEAAYKTGSSLFLVSRIIGASLRLYLVALVLQYAICDALGIPFFATVFISIGLIYLYTFRGGIKTVVWTDSLQTFCMLLSAGIAVYMINDALGWSFGEMVSELQQSKYTDAFVWDWRPANGFFKQFISGAAIAFVMTGLDQDMMQKNLTCRSLKDAQKNMFWFSVVLVFVNLLFLSLGALIYIYSLGKGLMIEPMITTKWVPFMQDATGVYEAQRLDRVFAVLALHDLGAVAGIFFILGVIAAAYSSADSALTSLTTSFCIDILDFRKWEDEAYKRKVRYLVHVGFSLILFVVIMLFSAIADESVIWTIFKVAGYTYGPLLGLYTFGLFTKREAKDAAIPFICIISPILSYMIQYNSPALLGYTFGFEILLLNGALTFLGLLAVSRKG